MFIGFFGVFISLIIAGAMYFISPIDPSSELLSNAKDRVSGAISGLLILALTYLIVTTINPQLSIFKLGQLSDNQPAPPAQRKQGGIYFYNKSGCPDSDPDVLASTASITDLGKLKNRVNAVGFVRDSNSDTAYITVLYDTINFKGKCQYLDPNKDCHSVEPFANSASVYKYDFSPNGDGVYFYRKSYFNDKGGYYKIKNSEIKNIYVEKLDDLKFTGNSKSNNPDSCTVENKEEQDCTEYDKNGNCVTRACPTLGGENISSIKINGNYFVLLVYFSPQDNEKGPWTACQAFPLADDVNKIGPQQIKWESIRNANKILPNYVVIIPVESK